MNKNKLFIGLGGIGKNQLSAVVDSAIKNQSRQSVLLVDCPDFEIKSDEVKKEDDKK